MLPFELTKDTPYLALSGGYGVSFMSISTEIDRVIKGFYCIYNPFCAKICCVAVQFRVDSCDLFTHISHCQ